VDSYDGEEHSVTDCRVGKQAFGRTNPHRNRGHSPPLQPRTTGPFFSVGRWNR
jgi:hypothetical protein